MSLLRRLIGGKMALVVDIQKSVEKFKLDIAFETSGKALGLLGQSGSGKSMTLKCIAGLEKPDSGYIALDGKVFYDSKRGINLEPKDRKIGFVFQDYALFPHMTVAENIGYGIHKLARKERRLKVTQYLEQIKLGDIKNKYVSELSGGQKQRIAIARALITEPELLLFDEPFSALDKHLRYEMEQQITLLLKTYEGTSVFVTHDIAESYRVNDQIVVCFEGHKVGDGLVDEVFMSPKHIEVARVTGCKNIVQAKKVNNTSVHVPAWGEDVSVPATKDPINYIGIRAHHIRWCSDENSEGLGTVLECDIKQVIPSPFEIRVVLTIKNKQEGRLIWVMEKDKWTYISRHILSNNTVRVVLDSSKILCM